MKKRISLFITTIMAIVAIPAATFAAASFDTIKGTIYDSSHQPVNNALVTVICNGNVKKTHSASDGTYSVQYNVNKCPNGTTASVTATKGHKGGEKNAVVNGTTTANVTIADVTFVPEFGLITAGAATIIGGAAFVAIRRKQLSGHQA